MTLPRMISWSPASKVSTLEHEIRTSLMSYDTYLYDTLIVRIFSSEIRQNSNFQEFEIICTITIQWMSKAGIAKLKSVITSNYNVASTVERNIVDDSDAILKEIGSRIQLE